MALPTLADYRNRLNTVDRQMLVAGVALSKATEDLAKAGDESRYFTPEEREAQTGRALPVVIEAEGAAAEAVEAALALSDDVLDATANPAPTLSPADQALAASRAVFVKEDAATLSIVDLIGRIRQAALEGDRVSLFLFARYAKARLAPGAAAGQADRSDLPDGEVPFPPSSPVDGDARVDLARLLTEIETSFRDPAMTALRDQALALKTEAFKIDQAVNARQDKARVYAFQSSNEVAW